MDTKHLLTVGFGK